MNAQPATDYRVPDIQFDLIMSSDDVVAFIRNELDGTILHLKSILMLAAMGRATMVRAFHALDEDEAIHIIECVSTFSQWLKDTTTIADAVFHRSIIAAAEIADILKPLEYEA